ncbi:Hypothetical_protein [Hexamita inflata]|uniref:Hypothetical_protein n=1 Tax=Hexamita inflata TaxID=28002 RepID=A0AA86TCW4_9EUKA|nr:Hypothetical protein HINF_LOCUS2789 [Hexamita inflata]
MCEGCCKALWVKITYTLFVGVIFVSSLIFSFDIYMQSHMFQNYQFKNTAPEFRLGCQDEAFIKSPLFHIPITSGFYNKDTQCFSGTRTSSLEEFYNYKEGKSTTVEVNTTVNGVYFMKEVNINCVSKEYVDEDPNNSIVYYVSAGCSWGGLNLAILLLICIWFCCSDWCRCCCCHQKDVKYTKVYMAYA